MRSPAAEDDASTAGASAASAVGALSSDRYPFAAVATGASCPAVSPLAPL